MSVIIPVILIPIYVSAAWLAYFGAKWVAALFVPSQVDQSAMALLAVAVTIGVLIAGLMSREDR